MSYEPKWACTHEGCGWTGTYRDSFAHVEETGHAVDIVTADLGSALAAMDAADQSGIFPRADDVWACLHEGCGWRGDYHASFAHVEASGHGVAPARATLLGAPIQTSDGGPRERLRATDAASITVDEVQVDETGG